MKREIQVTLDTYVHSNLDGKTIPEAIKILQDLAGLYEPRCTNLRLDWDGDHLFLVGTREECDEEEQQREQREAKQRASELRTLAHLKAKYEGQ